jgi:hypothetical protein
MVQKRKSTAAYTFPQHSLFQVFKFKYNSPIPLLLGLGRDARYLSPTSTPAESYFTTVPLAE